jgi:phosphoribosylglycinamide formyltransferase-1
VKKRIILLASGTGSLASSIMQAVRESYLDLEIVRVISDRPAAVLDVAASFSIQASLLDYSEFESRVAWSDALENLIEADSIDLIVSVGFMRILPASFVEKYLIINTHPALLPHFPGAHAVRDALAAGVGETGATVHWVDAGVDTGEVIAQTPVSVEAGDTVESLHERIKIVERKLIVETLKKFTSEGLKKSEKIEINREK